MKTRTEDLPTIERRAFGIELRAKDDAGKTLVGHAAVFNQIADMRWFKEKIAPGAFAESIGQDDIRALWNHNTDYVLGRNRAKTLRLSEDAVGLAIEIDLPDNRTVRDLVLGPIQRGDVSQMSFMFEALKEEWDEEPSVPVRTLLKAKLWETSPVTFAAYPTTDIAARSAFEKWREGRIKGVPVEIARRKLDLESAS
jgi:HK97 family phage prohead protease